MFAFLRRRPRPTPQGDLLAAELAATTLTVPAIPPCRFCATPAAYRAVLIASPSGEWADLCHPHMMSVGPGMLGTSLGQRLQVADVSRHGCRGPLGSPPSHA